MSKRAAAPHRYLAVVLRVAAISCLWSGAMTPVVRAASFDCLKAHSQVERLICAQPSLQHLDEQLARAYKVLEPAPDNALLRADQQSWIAERNRCKQAACLRQMYSERLTVLRAAGKPFQWPGSWWRVDASGKAPAHLVVKSPTPGALTFAMTASAGANDGELTGAAVFGASGQTGPAVYHAHDTSGAQDCTLVFRRVLNRIEISQQGGAAACEAGNGVYYGGTYVSSVKDPNPMPDLLTRGVFERPEEDAAFRRLVGADYEKFVDTADVIDSEIQGVGQRSVTQVNMFVRGLACNTKSVVLFDTQGHLWAAVWEAGDEVSEAAAASPPASAKRVRQPLAPVTLRYYTNVAGDKKRLPEPINAQRAACSGDEVRVVM